MINRLNRKEAIVYLVDIPSILGFVLPFVSDLSIVVYAARFLPSILVFTWYYTLFGMLVRRVPVNHKARFLTTAGFAYLLVSLPFNLVSSTVFRAIVAGLDVLALLLILGFVSVALRDAFRRDDEAKEVIFIFLSLVIYPIGIWRYQEHMRRWGQVKPNNDLVDY